MLRKIDTNLLILLAGVILGGGLGLISWAFQKVSGSISGMQAFWTLNGNKGYVAVDFTLESISGDTVQLSDFQGKPVLVNFWATWCGPCQVEMPLIQEFYDKYSPGLGILAVNYDEPVEDVRSFIGKLGLSFPVLLDPGGKITDLYQVKGFPTTYFIDREGIVRGVYIGTLSKGTIEDYLKKIGVGE